MKGIGEGTVWHPNKQTNKKVSTCSVDLMESRITLGDFQTRLACEHVREGFLIWANYVGRRSLMWAAPPHGLDPDWMKRRGHERGMNTHAFILPMTRHMTSFKSLLQ